MDDSKASGISIWLSSSREISAYKSLKNIIDTTNSEKNRFEPHVTLAHLGNAREEDAEDIIQKTRLIAKKIPPFNVDIDTMKTGNTFFKSIYLDVKLSESLKNIRDQGVELLKAENHEYLPHFSLFYGPHDEEKISQIKKAVKENNLENSTIVMDRLDVYLCEGSVDQWVHLGTALLGDDLFFRSALFINNKWTNPTKKNYLPVINPATKETFHYFPAGTSEDINKAVIAAKLAFKTWRKTTGEQRAKYLNAIASKVRERLKELAKIEVLDNGKPMIAAEGDMGDVAACFEYYANQAIELDKKQNKTITVSDSSYSCQVRFDPVGVAGMIVPWNYPLLMAAWKVAPCLASGCTGVLKPSELTPLTALELGAILKEVGIPPGVMNIVTGLGPEAGQPLSDHPDVEKIAFTGSVPTGCKVMASSSKNVKKISLELGGKSPFIVFNDVDLDQVTEWVMFGIFANQGQVCSATSRLLVEQGLYETLLNKLVEECKKIKIGSGLIPDNILGPIVSEGQYNKVLDYIRKGQEHGAKVICGGIPKEEDLLKGYFIPPTIFMDVDEKNPIWQEEIFGPVLAVKQFKTEEEALELANNSEYGLAAAVMSKDKERCRRVASALHAGIVWINCSQPTFVEAPWGGIKRSGIGRELGPWGLENYLEIKQITTYEDETGLGYQWYIKKK